MAVLGRVGESRMKVLDLGDQLLDLRLQQRKSARTVPFQETAASTLNG
jgi:hypothetical protein